MMDDFEEKRNMVKMLLEMLKGSAAKEVSDGMQKPEGMPDAKGLEIEKVSVLPHDEHESDDESPEGETLADQVLPKGSVAEEMKRAPEMAAEDDMENDDEPASAFSSFLRKKKK